MSKERLDNLLVARGLAPSRARAQAIILAGKVEVDGIAARKAGDRYAEDAAIVLREDDHPYVSRGALKLVKGLDSFAIDPAGLVALDIGASTGGFTDVLLRRGAQRVYALDVGYGQLAWSLRNDPRVVVLERTNVREVEPGRIPEPADLAVIDTSFISLTLVLPHVATLLGPPGGKPIVALVKPQFEVGSTGLGKHGVVRDGALYPQVERGIRAACAAAGLEVVDWFDSAIRGGGQGNQDGNREYFIRARHAAAPTPKSKQP